MRNPIRFNDRQNLTGQKFNRLTVTAYVGKNNHKANIWICRCECGKELEVVASRLRTGHTKSCGCIRALPRTHGQTSRTGCTPEYAAWKNMRNRCQRPSCKEYRLYGARGITVCERWEMFENFFADMGPKPSPSHSLDRIDVNGNYEPGGCRWATPEEQQNNKRRHVHATINGEKLTVMQWIRRLNLPVNAIYSRILRGWLPEEALLTPIAKKKSASDGRFIPLKRVQNF